MKPFDAMQIYDEFYPRIFRYVLTRIGNAEASRDIAAEVFFKMVKNRWRFKLTAAPVSAWLFRVASNEIATFYRRAKYRPVQLEAALEQAGELPLSLRGDLQEELSVAQALIDRHDVFSQIRRHLLRLPAKYQEVIVLHYLEEQTVPQIALLLGKKEGTVKSLISRGIAKLRAVVEGEEHNISREAFFVDEEPGEKVRAL